MPSALVSALAAPLHDVQAIVGPGSHDSAALIAAREALADVAAAARRSWAGTDWSGTAAAAAHQHASATAAAADALAQHADLLAGSAQQAGDAVAQARARLQHIIDDFEAKATALEPLLDEPGVAERLLADARHALREAISVVDQLRTELDQRAAAVAPSQAPSAGFSPGIPGMGLPSFALPSRGAAGGGGGSPAGQSRTAARFTSTHRQRQPRDAAMFGDGVAIRLPDGSSDTAPNAVAASAVRHALTQLGVPYQWGGTAPGVGLDCSGLTQWAYHEAGLELPRLAQEQDVGAQVAADALRPGDLAVWDGHVAMIVGNGTMIEAGDPVQLSPIRTTNAGQGFHGFFRPTA